MGLNYGITKTGSTRHIVATLGLALHWSYCGRLVNALPSNDQGRELIYKICQSNYDHWQKADAHSAVSGSPANLQEVHTMAEMEMDYRVADLEQAKARIAALEDALRLPVGLTAEDWAEFVSKDEGKTKEINILTQENREQARLLAERDRQHASDLEQAKARIAALEDALRWAP